MLKTDIQESPDITDTEKQIKNICLLNDSFPPQVDGVLNAVLNYAKHIERNGYGVMVVTPSHPDADDSEFSYPVHRYLSVNFSKMNEYRAGIPFSPTIAKEAREQNIALLHTHCPIMSTFMARELRQILDAPIVLTYHTKFDVDIANIIKNKRIQSLAKKAMTENISACDEVWVVSNGAGESLRALGYQGDYYVMPNGVDVPRGRVSDEAVASVTADYDLPTDIPVYLFVGRMMWYKGLRIILDGLSMLNSNGKDFRCVFVGDGDDRPKIMEYAQELNIADKCIFTGMIRDREALRAWYTRADLFLFPSSYDTNGLVVREASASSLAAVLLKDSCAAEGVVDGRNGFLIDENGEALGNCLLSLYDDREKMKKVGECACDELYISWEDAVAAAINRYEIVIERYKNGYYKKPSTLTEVSMKNNGRLMKALSKLKRNNQ